MANKQSRRSVSVSRGLFERMREESERDGVTGSHWLALLVKSELDRRGRPYNVQTTHMPRSVFNRIRATKARGSVRT